MMKQLLFLLLLAAFLGGTAAAPILTVLGFGPATAYAQTDQGDEDDQGEDNDEQ